VTLFDDKCKPVYDLGGGPYNTVLWNPFGRFLAIAGFGNLPGGWDASVGVGTGRGTRGRAGLGKGGACVPRQSTASSLFVPKNKNQNNHVEPTQ